MRSRPQAGSRSACCSRCVPGSIALTLSMLDLLLHEDLTERLADWLVGVLGGTEHLEAAWIDALVGGGATALVAGLVALGGLVWAASGLMGSIRIAFRTIWAGAPPPHVPTFAGKPYDLVFALATGIVVVAGFRLSIVTKALPQLGGGLGDALGLTGVGDWHGSAIGIAPSLGLTFACCVVLYRLVPPVSPPTRALVIGAAAGAIGFEVARRSRMGRCTSPPATSASSASCTARSVRCSGSCSSSTPGWWRCWSERSSVQGGHPTPTGGTMSGELVATDDGYDITHVGAGIAPRLPAFPGDRHLPDGPARDDDQHLVWDQRLGTDFHCVAHARPAPPSQPSKQPSTRQTRNTVSPHGDGRTRRSTNCREGANARSGDYPLQPSEGDHPSGVTTAHPRAMRPRPRA